MVNYTNANLLNMSSTRFNLYYLKVLMNLIEDAKKSRVNESITCLRISLFVHSIFYSCNFIRVRPSADRFARLPGNIFV